MKYLSSYLVEKTEKGPKHISTQTSIIDKTTVELSTERDGEYNQTKHLNETEILCPPCNFISRKLPTILQFFSTGNIALLLCVIIIVVIIVMKIRSKRRNRYTIPPENNIEVGNVTPNGRCTVNENVQL